MNNTHIRYFNNRMNRAPIIPRSVGGFLPTFKQFAVNGVDVRIADKIEVIGQQVTVTAYDGHIAEVDAVMRLSGTNTPGLDGDFKVLNTTKTTYSGHVMGVSDITLIQTGSHSLAPLDWVEVYSEENMSIFKVPDPNRRDFYFRIDDSIDENVGVTIATEYHGGRDLAGKISETRYWSKGSSHLPYSTPAIHDLISNGRWIYHRCQYDNDSIDRVNFTAAGRPNALDPYDLYPHVICGPNRTDYPYMYWWQNGDMIMQCTGSDNRFGIYSSVSDRKGIRGKQNLPCWTGGFSGSVAWSGARLSDSPSAPFMAYPTHDRCMVLSKSAVYESDPVVRSPAYQLPTIPRSFIPGLRFIQHRLPDGYYQNGQHLTLADGMRVMALTGCHSTCFIELDGDWQ